MADQKIAVTVDGITSGSIERVAFDLMEKIAYPHSTHSEQPAKKDRAYWLTLYSQCLGIVKGAAPKDTLEGWKL